MKIGFIGLGKLGLPVAVAMTYKGHDVLGYDICKEKMSKTNYPFKEVGRTEKETFQDILPNSTINFANNVKEVIDHAELLFIAIQTPHDKLYEGDDIFPENTKDFDYTALKECLKEVVKLSNKNLIVSIISTVSPGTYARELNEIMQQNSLISYCYNPYFIAMGTVITDFLNPEFVLIGGKNNFVKETMEKFYKTIHNKPVLTMDISSAEIVKMSYNTMIGLKIIFANNIMEMCHKIGGNVDDVTNALKTATDRLISPKYLTAGMGDGGGCHPRDNIALSHIAQQYKLSSDLGGLTMKVREQQANWLTELMIEESEKNNLPNMYILGKAFKPETNIETGSPAILCYNLLKRKGYKVEAYEPFSGSEMIESEACVFLIGCKHEVFKTYVFPKGSVVIDPHRYIPKQEGVQIIRVGENL